MLALACDRFEQQNLYCAEAEHPRGASPDMLKLTGRVGSEQSELLMRYPGIHIGIRGNDRAISLKKRLHETAFSTWAEAARARSARLYPRQVVAIDHDEDEARRMLPAISSAS